MDSSKSAAKEAAGKLASWINLLERALEDFQVLTDDLMTDNTPSNRRALLNIRIASSGYWRERPAQDIKALYEAGQL